MSYMLRLAADARRALAALPLGAQEEVLDIVERCADEVDPLSPDVLESQYLVYRTDREVVYVRIYCTVHHDITTVTFDRLVAVIVDQ